MWTNFSCNLVVMPKLCFISIWLVWSAWKRKVANSPSPHSVPACLLPLKLPCDMTSTQRNFDRCFRPWHDSSIPAPAAVLSREETCTVHFHIPPPSSYCPAAIRHAHVCAWMCICAFCMCGCICNHVCMRVLTSYRSIHVLMHHYMLWPLNTA